MLKYIALLRGINVGGHRKLKMKDLRAMLKSMGFKNISTYIQSGNVVFETDETDVGNLESSIKEQIDEQFGYQVPVIIRTHATFKKALNNIPYEKKEGWKRYITFLSEAPDTDQKKLLESQSSTIEQFSVGDKEIYVQVDKQTSQKPKFSSSFIQQKLNISATNRNLRTVNKILELASSAG